MTHRINAAVRRAKERRMDGQLPLAPSGGGVICWIIGALIAGAVLVIWMVM